MNTGRQEGQATVELALLLPLIVTLLLCIVQVGLIVRDQLRVAGAAREGARAAAVEPTTAAATAAAVRGVQLEPERTTVELARSGQLATVTVRYASATSVPIVGLVLGDVRLTSSVTMRIE